MSRQPRDFSRRDFLQTSGLGLLSLMIVPSRSPASGREGLETADGFIRPLGSSTGSGYRHLEPTLDPEGQPDGGYHIGVDFNAQDGNLDDGAGVRLIGNGLCMFAGSIGAGCGLGKMAVFRHHLNDGSIVYSRFGHLKEVHVEAGRAYRVGTLLGRMGKSGCQRSTHLHLDMAYPEAWERYLRERPGYYPWRAPRWWLSRLFFDPIAFLAGHRVISAAGRRTAKPR